MRLTVTPPSARFDSWVNQLRTSSTPEWPASSVLDFALFAELPSARELQGGSLILLGLALPITVTLRRAP